MYSRDNGLVDNKYEVNTITHWFCEQAHFPKGDAFYGHLSQEMCGASPRAKACLKVMYMGNVCNRMCQHCVPVIRHHVKQVHQSIDRNMAGRGMGGGRHM